MECDPTSPSSLHWLWFFFVVSSFSVFPEPQPFSTFYLSSSSLQLIQSSFARRLIKLSVSYSPNFLQNIQSSLSLFLNIQNFSSSFVPLTFTSTLAKLSMYSYRDFLLLNFIENNLCRGFPFWAVKCGTNLFPNVYMTFRQGLKSRHVSSFVDKNKQLTFHLALGVLVIKHNIHMFNVLVQISRFIVAI